MKKNQPYQELIRRVKEYSLLASCGSVLAWDERTYMPRKGSAHRAEQIALVARMTHEMATVPEIGRLLEGGAPRRPQRRSMSAGQAPVPPARQSSRLLGHERGGRGSLWLPAGAKQLGLYLTPCMHSLGSTAPRLLTTFNWPLLTWAMYMFIRTWCWPGTTCAGPPGPWAIFA